MFQILETEQDQLMDSVQDGFCTECGAYYGSVEPDAEGYHCEDCGENKVKSLTMILLF